MFMLKSGLVVALLMTFMSVAQADTAAPTSQGATSVQGNLDANKSNGNADKGLTTAQKNITADRSSRSDNAMSGGSARSGRSGRSGR
jgi:hypothetical protein